MKINTIIFERNLKGLKLLVAILCLILSFNQVLSECNSEFGCLARKKFMAYVTVQTKDSTPKPLRTILDYKIIYIFTDRMVFYTSTDAGNASLESEDNTEEIEKIEAKIERVINFGEIILDCGKCHNKLCHAQEYPGIEKIESFKKVETIIKTNADVLCLIIPFFENGYQKLHEKMAYICGTNSNDLFGIITLKNDLSRKIELYQLKMSADRYNGFNGLLRKKANFVMLIDGKKMPVTARIYNKGISFITNDESKQYLKDYSFYQQRLYNTGVYLVADGLVKNRVPKDWSSGWSPEPNPDCCIYLKGETENKTLCYASSDGDDVESASDICKVKLKSLLGEFTNSIRGIKFAEAYHELSHNKVKLANCKSPEYKIMKYRAEKTILYAINVDCKFIMNYINQNDYDTKMKSCYTNYGDELSLELKLMSLNNESIYNGISECVYKSADFAKNFEKSYFNDLLKKFNLVSDTKPQSFIENAIKETDEIDDDDEDVNNVQNNKNNIELNKELINFTEVKSGNDQEKEKPTSIKDYVYSKPKESYESADTNKIQIFRNSQMEALQNKHTWTPSPRESMNGRYNKENSSLGKKNMDEFVSFLGYLGDGANKVYKKK